MPSMGVAGQLNGSREPERRSRSVNTIDREELVHQSYIDFVPPIVLQEQISQDSSLSQDVKSWLISFGELKPGTQVSLRFKISETDIPRAEPFSLLPLLTTWMRQWFEKSYVKSVAEAQDRNSLTWLFQYSADYVELGHWRLDHDEVQELCLELLNVCLNARHQAHLEGSLAVLLSIAKVGEFPRACLKGVLTTLSQANVILDKPLSKAGELIELLATGALAKDAITELLSALSVVASTQDLPHSPSLPEADVAKYLNPARGALRYLSTLLEVCGQNEKFVVDIHELLTVLKDIAETRLLRLATEILDLLSNLLSSVRVEEVIDDRSLTATLLDTYDVCKKASVIPDSADNSLVKTKSPNQDQINRERRYRRDHDQALSRFRDNFGKILPIMAPEDGLRMWREYRNLIQCMPAEKRAGVIEYLVNQELCIPGKNENWNEELFLLLDNIIIADTTEANAYVEKAAFEQNKMPTIILEDEIARRTQQRLDIMQICAKAVEVAPHYTKQTKGNNPLDEAATTEVGFEALQKLLKVFNMETDNKVIQPLLDHLVNLSSVISSKTWLEPYNSKIVDGLKNGIMSHARDSNDAEHVYVAGAKALRSIFLKALGRAKSSAQEAFNALLEIAGSQACKSARCRLVAMSVLVRIRCHTNGLIYIERGFESTQIAAAVCRTSDSLGAMFQMSLEISGDDTEKATLSSKHHEIFRRQLWYYPEEADAIRAWPIPDVYSVYIKGNDLSQSTSINIEHWTTVVLENFQQDKEWETYSYLLVHLGAQLSNTSLFEGSQHALQLLRGFLCNRVREPTKMFVPPRDIGLVVSDVAICFYHILIYMIPFHTGAAPFAQDEAHASGHRGVDLVRAFLQGLHKNFEGTSRMCIHALSMCCFELPKAIENQYGAIVDAMTQSISRPNLMVHILEFLAQVARLPRLHARFNEHEIKQVIYICIRALQALRQKDEAKTYPVHEPKSSHTKRTLLLTPYRTAMMKEKGLSQYSCALAYHTMIFWFLSIPLGKRHLLVKDITEQLTWTDSNGKDIIDEQTIVMVDMMQRSAYSDLAETHRNESFSGSEYSRRMFIVGNSIIEIETHKEKGSAQITKRQASGTTHALYYPNIQELPVHHDTSFFEQLEERGFHDKVDATHTVLNLVASAVPTQERDAILELNLEDDQVTRAVSLIDRKPTVDSHKIGVILLKEFQMTESEYLANTEETTSFKDFMEGMGTKVSLEPPCPFIPWGLVYEEDGVQTVAWRDRINEIVLEVSTLMPNSDDEYQARKKSHIGNCYVLIVFDESKKEWKWEKFASQVTLVQILVTPANNVPDIEDASYKDHDFFEVEVLTKEDYQNISPAAEAKVVSKSMLAPFVRMLALNATIFSECARNESTGDAEFPSSWRYRLQAILQLKERTLQRQPERKHTIAEEYDFTKCLRR